MITYSNPYLPRGTDECPLVTFSVLAYNQEKYIRQAVEGAFSQTYSPLEIILSDDYSSDRTFEIMQEMAAAYDGPHKVRVRRSLENIGTLGHLLTVAREANGSLLVVAAGDDISLPERTSVLSTKFSSDKISAVSSDDIVIDEDGVERNWKEDRFDSRDKSHRENPVWILGATAAYKNEFLKEIPIPKNRILHEDTALEDILEMSGKKSCRIRDKLIQRRSHLDNVAFKADVDDSFDQREDAALARWARVSEVKSYSAEVAVALDNKSNFKISERHSANSRYYYLLSRWPHLRFSQRVELFFLAVRWGSLRTCLPRLFGRRVFRALKSRRLT